MVDGLDVAYVGQAAAGFDAAVVQALLQAFHGVQVLRIHASTRETHLRGFHVIAVRSAQGGDGVTVAVPLHVSQQGGLHKCGSTLVGWTRQHGQDGELDHGALIHAVQATRDLHAQYIS